jgi:hypothetical protein
MGQTLRDLCAPEAVTENDSLSANDIAAFLDGRLSGADLTRVQSLLANDASARKEVAEASRLIATAPRRRTMPARWLVIGGMAAIAAAALMMVRPGHELPDSARVAAERRAPVDASERIELVSPGDGQSVEKSNMILTWRSIDGAAYRVVVSDPAGKMVFEQSTNDTSVAVPLNSLEQSKGVLYWSVDALAPDGSSVTSGARALTVAAK